VNQLTDPYSPVYSLRTLYGKRLTVSQNTREYQPVTVAGADIVIPNIDAGNGIIQGVDRVVMR
jgi:uncharacterized surface protein with fasciclin (FAS1) repeats